MEGESQPATRTLTVTEAAEYFGRTERLIQYWCKDGTLLSFGYAVIRERNGRWMIVIPLV
jgi:hypothetical protein